MQTASLGSQQGAVYLPEASRKEGREEIADNQIVVRGAREHNLKDITVSLPRDVMVVVKGL